MPLQINQEVLTAFLEEVAGYLPEIRAGVAALGTPAQELPELRRLLHTIKGASSMIGLASLSHLAFLGEELVSEFLGGRTNPGEENTALLGQLADAVEEFLTSIAMNNDADEKLLAPTREALERLRGKPAGAASPAATPGAPEALVVAEFALPAPTAASLPSAVVRPLPPPSRPEAPPPSPSRPSGAASRPRPVPMMAPPVEEPAAAAPESGGKYAGISQDLTETFVQEAEEILHNLGVSLRAVSDGEPQQQHLLDIRRAVHTLKGASASLGLKALSQLAHRMEDLLDEVNQGRRPFTPETLSLFFETFDCLADMASAEPDPASLGTRVERLYRRYDSVLTGAPAAKGAIPVAPAPEAPGAARLAAAAEPSENPEQAENFRPESEELLRNASENLRNLQHDPANREALAGFRRSVDAWRAGAVPAGLDMAAELARCASNLCQRLTAGAAAPSQDVLARMFSTLDTLSDLAGESPESAAAQAESLLTAYAREEKAAPAAAPSPAAQPKGDTAAAAAPAGKPDAAAHKASQYVRVPLERLDEVVRLVSELVVNRSTFERHLDSYSHDVDELGLSIQRLKRVSSRLDTDFEVSALGGFGQLAVRAVQMPGAAVRMDGRAEFDALEFDRYTDLHLVSRDLSETTADVSSAAGELSDRIGDFDGCINRLGRLSSELQDKLMRLRMVPLETLALRLHRSVRVAAEREGREADLVIQGQQVEMDKALLEEMAGPLEHLLRNAVHHGIELPTLRAALGKPERGRVTLSAFNEGTQVVIQIADDGSGLPYDRLRAAAVRQGIYSQADAARVSEAELRNLIFRPGFSTASAVGETSGRGVGMDVVRTTVHKLKGTISVDSTPGAGSKFTIRLPLTLALMRVLLVSACGETFAVPLGVITKIERVEPREIERVGASPVVSIDGKVLPAAALGEVLHLAGKPDPLVERLPVLVLSVGERKLALVVDHIVEAREVVVKSMGSLLNRVDAITGATLLGDGSVVLIVNPSDLFPAIEGGGEAGPGEPAVQREEPALSEPSRSSDSPLDVMVVDDSVSVRKVLSNLVRSLGWNPTMAKDGMEALEILQRSSRTPDAILLDIEMPRMDGYELTVALRNQPRYRNVPIVMLTSRAGEKHRIKAFELGATEYLVKPYHEETLISVVRRVVAQAREAVAR